MVVKSKDSTTKAYLKTAAPLLTRTAVFLSIFIIYSGLLGHRIIGHGLSSHDGFEIYGGAGKSLLFGAVCLALLIYRHEYSLKLSKWKPISAVWLILSAICVLVDWHFIGRLITDRHSSGTIIFTHIFLLASIVLAAFGSYGYFNLKRVVIAYKRELLIAIALAVGFYFFLLIVYSLWKFLASIVLHSVKWLMGIIGVKSFIVPPRSLVFNKFGINIAEYCSGIESITLFTGLYALIGILDWQRFNHNKYLYLFPIGLMVLFLFNILRVFLLILGGYYINPTIAFSLFHTYAGMVFFILYSIIFWCIFYKPMTLNRYGHND